MAISGSYMITITTKRNNNDRRGIPTHLLAYLLTLIVKELKISVEQGRVVKAPNIIQH